MSIWTNPGKVIDNIKEHFASLWATVKAHLPSGVVDEIEPVIEGFVDQFASPDNALIFKESWQAVDQLLEGKKFGEVAEELLHDLTTKSATLAASDLGKVLLMIQNALQIAKYAKGILTEADHATVAAVPTPQAVS